MCIHVTVIHLAVHQDSKYRCCTIYNVHGGQHDVISTIIVLHCTTEVFTPQFYCRLIVDCIGPFSVLIKLIQ